MADQNLTKSDQATVLKFDESLGLILGYAIVSKIDGVEHFDLQGDHIPEDAMLKASEDFMRNSRVAKEMHDGDPIGSVIFAWPMTSEIAASLDISVRKTGLLVAIKPEGEEALAKARSGEYRGFSIGGRRIRDEDASE